MVFIMSLSQRIRKRRIELNITQTELAKILGYRSRSSINKIEQGQNDLPQSKIILIAQALQCSPAYLMGWEENAQQTIDKADFEKYNLLPINTYKIPLLGSIACGEPILAAENIESYIDAESTVKADFALRCKGDSMINARIFDGDIVFVRQQPDVENGEIAAVLIDDTATLKRVYKYPNRLELRPENPTFEVLNFEDDEISNIKIMGKAVAFLSGVR